MRLPRLPVPDLRKTLDRYLKSLEPFLLEDEARGGPSFVSAHALRKKWADEFACGIGQVCQQRLVALDKLSPNNWLDDNFWLKKAYLEWRAPLLINSNWWLAFLDDEQLKLKMNERRSLTDHDELCFHVGCSPWQIRRTSWLLHRILEFKNKIESQELHPDTTRTGIWLRENVNRMFSIGRTPKKFCDIISSPPIPNPHAGEVVLTIRGWFYQLTVVPNGGELISPVELECRLLGILSDVKERLASGERAPSIGVLSADERDTWAKNLQRLLNISPSNRDTYEAILYSLMNISLETTSYSILLPSKSLFQRNLDEHLHTVRSTPNNVANRFFDKPFTLIVDPLGRAGAMGEHAPCDALVPSIVAEYAVANPVDDVTFSGYVLPAHTGWCRLDWVVDPTILEECTSAKARADKLISDSDNSVMWFTDYGLEWIKSLRLSPDAYIQIALQLAWYRTRGEFTAVYETVLTRMFHKGRTETVRSFTRDSRAYVLAMGDPSSSPIKQSELLYRAVHTHAELTREAATGRGIDRHLLGLRLLLKEDENAALFDDELFQQSSRWKLSTSGLSAGHHFRGTGFGASYLDGYGINYLAAPEMIKFGIESKFSSPRTSTAKFLDAVSTALFDMKQILGSKQSQVRVSTAHL